MQARSAPEVWTVSQLTGFIKQRLESDARLSHCTVTGELSNFKHHTSGHMYFTLKDDTSRVRALMFSSRNRNLSFVPKDGMRVVCRGAISVFDRDGQYQLYVDDMQPDGVGALYAAFVELRDRLEREGLFSAERKRPLPAYPRVVGVVTSPTGAVIRDICTTLGRRFPLAQVLLAPALVQGPGAAETIIAGIRKLAAHHVGPRVDVIIVGRGGGSLEELWPFNEEAVARAIAQCPVPVVSAVGHETDFTICDFVADVRAATPTAAAELVAPSVTDIRASLETTMTRVTRAVSLQAQQLAMRLERAAGATVLSDPLRMTDRLRERVDYHEAQLKDRVSVPLQRMTRRLQGMSERLHRYPIRERLGKQQSRLLSLETAAKDRTTRQLEREHRRLAGLEASVQALNPLAVLGRGYSVVTRQDGGGIVASAQSLQRGDPVNVHFQDGKIEAVVTRQGDEENGRPVQSRLDI